MIDWIGSDEHWAILAVAFLAELAVVGNRYVNRLHHHLESHRKLRATHPESPAADPTALPNAAAAGTQTSTLQSAGGGLDVDQGLRCEPALPLGERGESGDESHPPTSGSCLTLLPDVGPQPRVATVDTPPCSPTSGGGLGQPPVSGSAPSSSLPLTGTQACLPDADRYAPADAALSFPGTDVASAIELLVGGASS